MPAAERFEFHQLLTFDELQTGTLSIPGLLEKAQEQLDAFEGSIDAIVGFLDFPASVMVPILCERYGLTSASPEAAVKCEHKYWSRLEQQKVIDEHPAFDLLDLDQEHAVLPSHVSYPVWIKPVISHSSQGAHYVENDAQLQAALGEERGDVDRLGGPFDDIRTLLELPEEIAAVGGRACLVEEAVTGDQFTVEGFSRDYWLKDKTDNGAMDGPELSIWMQDTIEPATTYEERPGRWVGEPEWPSPRVEQARYPLGRYQIGAPDETLQSPELSVQSPLSVGLYGGKWCSYNAPPDMPYDQREEDGGSLVFTTDPLPERLELLGSPTVELSVSADRPVAMVAVRLSDVAPNDAATRISYGLYNLNHSQGSDDPQPLEPGKKQTVAVELNGLAQSLPAGHRLRVSVSTSYWPVVWPSPETVRLTIDPEESCLVLPVRPRTADDDSKPPAFGEPEGAPPLEVTQVEPGQQDWEVSRNLVDLSGQLQVVKDLGVVRMEDIDLEVTRRAYENYSFVGQDVNSVRGETVWTMGFDRGDWKVRTTTKTVLTSTPTDFHVAAELDAYEGDQRVFSKNWSTTIPRDFI